MVAIHLLNKEVAEMWRSVNLRFAQGILLAVFLIYLLTMSTNLKLHNQSIIEHGSQRDGRAVQSDRLQVNYIFQCIKALKMRGLLFLYITSDKTSRVYIWNSDHA